MQILSISALHLQESFLHNTGVYGVLFKQTGTNFRLEEASFSFSMLLNRLVSVYYIHACNFLSQ